MDLHGAGQTVPRAAATPCRQNCPGSRVALSTAGSCRSPRRRIFSARFHSVKSPCLIPGPWLYDYVWEEIKKRVRMLLVVRLSTYLYQQIFSNVKTGHQRQSKSPKCVPGWTGLQSTHAHMQLKYRAAF